MIGETGHTPLERAIIASDAMMLECNLLNCLVANGHQRDSSLTPEELNELSDLLDKVEMRLVVLRYWHSSEKSSA